MAYRGPQQEAQSNIQGPNTGNPGGAYNMDFMSIIRNMQNTKQPAPAGKPMGTTEQYNLTPVGGSVGSSPAAVDWLRAQGGGLPNTGAPTAPVLPPGEDRMVGHFGESYEDLLRRRGAQDFSNRDMARAEIANNPNLGPRRYTAPTVNANGEVTNSGLQNFDLPYHHGVGGPNGARMGQPFDPMERLRQMFGNANLTPTGGAGFTPQQGLPNQVTPGGGPITKPGQPAQPAPPMSLQERMQAILARLGGGG